MTTMNDIFTMSHIAIMDEGENFIQFQDEDGTRRDPSVFGPLFTLKRSIP